MDYPFQFSSEHLLPRTGSPTLSLRNFSLVPRFVVIICILFSSSALLNLYRDAPIDNLGSRKFARLDLIVLSDFFAPGRVAYESMPYV